MLALEHRYRLIAISLVMVLLCAACGAPAPSSQAPSPSQTTSTEASGPTIEPTAIDAPEPTAESTPASPTPAAPTEPPAELPTATTPADEPTAASHPLPLDQPWVHARYELVAPDGAALNLQDEPTELPLMGIEVSPDGTWVAYAENGPGWIGLVLHDLRDGTETRFPGQIFRAKFSPDSTMITYSTIDQVGWRLVVQELPAGEPRVIAASNEGHLLGPLAWTPAGIVAEEIIWASDAPPQGLVLLDPKDGTSTIIREADHLDARVSADGTRIAIVTGVRMIGGPGEAGVAVLDRAQGDEQQIVPQQSGLIPAIEWSPNGSRLFYVSASIVEFTMSADALHVLSADGSESRTVAFADTGIEGIFRDATWRDDETLLVLTGDAGGTLRLYQTAVAELAAQVAQWEGAIGGLGDPAQIVRVPRP